MSWTDPWASIAVAPSSDEFNGRRADKAHAFDFWWARDEAGRCLLVLRYDDRLTAHGKRPQLDGIEICERATEDGQRSLVLCLLKDENREIFHKLCTDIISATESCLDDSAAIQVTIQRMWRWHRLLRGAGGRRLSSEAQKGLIGELSFLRGTLLSYYAPREAIPFWLGPSGAPKDFVVGETAIEVKARRGSARPFVTISSEHQLDTAGVKRLILHVVDLAEAPAEAKNSFTLDAVVAGVRAEIENRETGSLELFEEKLLEVGYADEHDYSDTHWIMSASKSFSVVDGFPRLVASSAPGGVEGVSYSVDLSACVSFSMTDQEVVTAVKEAGR